MYEHPLTTPRPSSKQALDRTSDGRFAKGNPGGPGRPRGPIVSGVTALDRLGADAGPDLIRLAIEEARSGNMKALEMVLERVWPKRRGRPVQFDLPPINSIDDVVTAHTAVTEGVMSGALTAQEGSALSDMLERQRVLVADTQFAKAIGAAYRVRGDRVENDEPFSDR
jgi:hypothetical protein